MKHPLIVFVMLWRRLVSPLYGDVCKYHPSCSAYGLKALQTHGAIYGSWLTIWRILRCNPWSKGGYDPVPGTPEDAQWQAAALTYLTTGDATAMVWGSGNGFSEQTREVLLSLPLLAHSGRFGVLGR